MPKAIRKYWLQRYHLFYKYDAGIQLDHESWYSVRDVILMGSLTTYFRKLPL